MLQKIPKKIQLKGRNNKIMKQKGSIEYAAYYR